jgi:hypothetical protein
VDFTAASGSVPGIVAYATNTGVAQTQMYNNTSTGTPNNDVPYKLLTASYAGYSLIQYDQAQYAAQVAAGTVFTTAFCPSAIGASDYPPLLFSTILPVNGSGVNAGPWPSSTCGYGRGIEFSMSQGYTVSGYTFNTSTPSDTTAGLAGIFASLAANHPAFNWFDIQASLRQTASNWATGYTVCSAQPSCLSGNASAGTTYGYGNVDYASANAIASTASIYLQPPGMVVTPAGGHAIVKLYPFRQSRRTAEVIYSVNPAYSWPVKNEYTAADIAASGATLLYVSNGTDVNPYFTYYSAINGTITFIAFTIDGAGNYSRAENFSEIQATLVVQTQCIQ